MTIVQTFLVAAGGFFVVSLIVLCIASAYGWKTIWEILNVLVSGAVAVNILHFYDNPSYLVLALGWVGLISCLASLGTVLQTMSGENKGPCACPICSNHRQQIGA